MTSESVSNYRRELQRIHTALLDLASNAAHTSVYQSAIATAQTITEALKELYTLEALYSTTEESTK